MSTKLMYTGFALVFGVPAIFSGDAFSIVGGACMIAATLYTWIKE